MKKDLWLEIIFSVVDVALLVCLFIFYPDYRTFPFWFLLIFPIIVALIIFLVGKYKRNFDSYRIWKRAVLAYFLAFIIPLGVVIIIVTIMMPVAQVKYGVPLEVAQIVETCRIQCEQTLSQGQQFFEECYNACISKFR